MSGFALRGLLSSVVLCEGKRGETSPWVSGQYQATAMPIRIRPISGLVCWLELTDNMDHVSITQTTTLQLEGIIGRVGTHFTLDNDNGESCWVVLFFIFSCEKKGVLYCQIRLPFSILQLGLYPSRFCALPLKPS